MSLHSAVPPAVRIGALGVFTSACLLAQAQWASGQAPSGGRDAGGPAAPTTRLERGRAVYVLSACHFCHGIDLTGAAMGAADLLHLPLVANDDNGRLIGVVVRKGLPNLQTAMPQYSDYTDQQISDLAAYIHYLRQQGRYRELTNLKDASSGDAAAGQQYFNSASAKCKDCHTSADLGSAIRKSPGDAAMRARFLRPGPENVYTGEGASDGMAAHLTMLERISDTDFRNIAAYLRSLR